MESRFGSDFGNVRVHTGSDAAAAARRINARAYTVGSHVVFGAGAYEPATAAGRRLIAHELTHVEQQRSGAAGRAVSDDAHAEREARDVSAIVASGGRASVRHGAPLAAQRDGPEGEGQPASPSPELQVDPEVQREVLRLFLRWWLGTTLVEGDAPTEVPEPAARTEAASPDYEAPSPDAEVPTPFVPLFPLSPDFFAPLPPDPLWVPPDAGSLYGAHLERGVPIDARDHDVLQQIYRDRLRLALGLPDLRGFAPRFIRPLIPTTWRRDIAGALTSATAGSGLKSTFPTPIDVADRAWQDMTGAGTTVIPLPSISFDWLGGGK